MSEEEIAEAQEVLDRYFAEGTEAERRFFADEYTLMEELAEDDWSDAEWRRYQLMSALYTKLDSIRSVTTGAIEGVPFCGNLFEWSARTQARVRGYQFEELCSMENIFINSHTQHPYATFVGNMTGGLLTYNMASSVAGHIPGLAQRIGGWSERLSTFPILRRIGQDHLSNIIGATIVDTGAFTVPKAIIDIYNGESSETVFRNAGVDIGRNVLFNIFGEAVSGAVGRVVQRFKSGSNAVIKNIQSKSPQQLIEDGWEDITNPKMAANTNSREFYDPKSGLKIRYDKGVDGENGFEAVDHYHVMNPNYTNKKVDYYLDIDGKPVGKGSKASHIVIKGEE